MIGLLGGTFDPVHVGHLRLALELLENLNLQEVRLIPLHSPPHRAPPMASAAARLAMLQAATQDLAGLCVDEREYHRAGPSYTVDTLLSLRDEWPHTPLCLIVGMDAFMSLPTWHRWHEILLLAHIVVAHRPGSAALANGNELAPMLAKAIIHNHTLLKTRPAGYVWLQPITQLDISSTRLRALIAAGKNIRYLVPDNVRRYIQEQRLYLP